MAYEKNSKEAKQGTAGEARALEIIQKKMIERGSKVVVRRGMQNSSANGKLGDILFSRPDEAPLVGIEVKAPSARYPDSISISRFEFNNTRAKWLLASNDDPELGIWIQPMSVIIAFAEEKQGNRGPNDKYYTCRPPYEYRVSLDAMLDEVQKIFGEI
mgnify:CR=1 FL=1